MSEKNLKDLKEMLKAIYPIIYLVSFEEKRIINIIDSIAKEKNMGHKIKIWSSDIGLVNSEGNKEGGENLLDPSEILNYIKNTPASEKTLYILKDFDSFIEDEIIQRSLRTLAEDSMIHVSIIIISPVLKLPIKLSKCIQVIEWALPDRNERNNIMNYDKKNVKLLNNEERDSINRAMAGLTEIEIVNVIARQAAIDNTKCVSIDLLNNEKLNIVKKNPVLEIYNPTNDDTFDNLGGWDNAKRFILERKNCFSEESRLFGVDPPKGILFFGIAGCGKSKFAKCVGKEYGLPVVTLSLARVMAQSGGIVGQSENWLAEAFKTIEAVAPCVVFMDEIEKGASGMESSGQSDGGMTSRMLTVFLDKLENRNSPFFVVATANNVHNLAPELVRPGRWDKLMFAGLPNSDERKKIFEIHLNKRNIDYENIDIDYLTHITDTYTGVEIEQIVKDAIILAFNSGKQKINTNMLISMAKEITPQSKYKGETIQSLVRWANENGAKFVSSQESDGSIKVLQMPKKE
jgi:SpoVK/Ycf46/Vps4 family AAA+-type ATPase